MQVDIQIDLESGALRCPRCFAKDLVASQSRSLLDLIMRRLGRLPRHCRFCGKRFYVPMQALEKANRPATPRWQGGRRVSRPPGSP